MTTAGAVTTTTGAVRTIGGTGTTMATVVTAGHVRAAVTPIGHRSEATIRARSMNSGGAGMSGDAEAPSALPAPAP